MYGWVDECMDGWVDAWVDRVDRRMDGRTHLEEIVHPPKCVPKSVGALLVVFTRVFVITAQVDAQHVAGNTMVIRC